MEKPQKKTLTPSEWETLIDDFHNGDPDKTSRWKSTSSTLLELSLSTLLKKDFPLSLKLHLLVFIDEFSDLLFVDSDDPGGSLNLLVETLKVVIQSPNDGVSITYSLKEQMLVTVTSMVLSIVEFSRVRVSGEEIEALVAILVTIINRPNHGVDRQVRAIACECLRELEREFPCLLAEIVGHLWGLCQNERTYASQCYLLLFLQVVHDIVVFRLSFASVFTTSVPLVPFNLPPWVRVGADEEGNEGNNEKGMHFGVEFSGLNLKELKRVMAFLLEWPQVLTPCGMVEFMSMIMPLVVSLELQPSLLKVQFSGLLYNFDPLLWHVVLMLFLQFPDMFNGHEEEICKRLVLISKERPQPLVFRLLVLHWLLGVIELMSKKDVEKRKLVVGMSSSFYPNVYDPLSLKSLKMDLLALCSIIVDSLESQCSDSGRSAIRYFEDGLVCVSAFKWLPPWSTETAVAFRNLHKCLIGASSHLDSSSSAAKTIMDSGIFRTIQMKVVNLLSNHQKLVPVVVALTDRFLHCQKHSRLGQNLLQTLDEHLLPKIAVNYKLSQYFMIFDSIAKNDNVPPHRLLELLTRFSVFLVEKHGPDTGLRSWSHGSKVLGVCRTMLMHHHTSRLFMGLSRLLAFVSLYFSDLEIRDSARIYLRMLICIPGKKLRHILNLGDQLVGVSPSPHSSSFFNVQSPRFSEDLNKSRTISSYIHLERVIPLLVKQSWSLSLPSLGYDVEKYGFTNGIKDGGELLTNGKTTTPNNNTELVPDMKRIDQPQVPLRVMDSKISGIVDILRMHFSQVPDFRHMPGLKIKIPCTLRFMSEPFNQVWGLNSSGDGSHLNAHPAMYALVLKFSSSAPYGSIPTYHIPFLLGESSTENVPSQGSMDIVPIEEAQHSTKFTSTSPVTIELEPRDPVPGLVDVLLDANAENGRIIHGKLQPVSVGIEDMFLKAAIPTEIPTDAVPEYYSNLFNALWEACGAASNTGRETFPLKGGTGFAAICGTQSVKLLEAPATFVVGVVERYLAPFVVTVIGGSLVDSVKDGGFIKAITWKDDDDDDSSRYVDERNLASNSDRGPLFLTYYENEDDKNNKISVGKISKGCFSVLIFLPPRYHLLFRMEVSDFSTLVRIRTDHWPCLAYVDEYLEALFSS